MLREKRKKKKEKQKERRDKNEDQKRENEGTLSLENLFRELGAAGRITRNTKVLTTSVMKRAENDALARTRRRMQRDELINRRRLIATTRDLSKSRRRLGPSRPPLSAEKTI